jgi:starch-binding outer membrane protein, SusD/RagB family
MRIQTRPALALAGILTPLALAACGLDVPDLNDPSLDDLKNHPTAISIGAACTGLLIGNRGNVAAEGGYVSQLGILGRESYNFDAADPRYIGELLAGDLSPGSPFGGNFWALPYANIQLGNVILGAVDKVSDLSAGDKSAIRGFTKTINAIDLLQVVVTHDASGAVLDVNPDPLGTLAPIVTDTKQQYDKIIGLLEGAVGDLDAAEDPAHPGEAVFPFSFGKGFAGFNTPSTFLKVNRAIRARVALYREDYATAMAIFTQKLSFLDDDLMTFDPNDGVYYAYSTKPGDAANALINPNIFLHPSIEADAAHNANNDPIDNRLQRKTAVAASPPGNDRATAGLPKHPGADGEQLPVLTFKGLYGSPESSVPLIRNEELVLLAAEARWFTNDHAGAIADLNLVRTVSGKLDMLNPVPTDDAGFIAALMYEREFSLLFEGGHRWIDSRRFDARFKTVAKLPIFIDVDKDTGKMTPDGASPDTPNGKVNLRYPIPITECDGRPDDPQCQ